EAAAGTQADQRPARPAGGKSAEVREPAEDAAGGVASGKRRAAAQGAAALRADGAGGVQEPGDRAGESGAGGKRRATRAGRALQVGVSREHVARAANAAEQPD